MDERKLAQQLKFEGFSQTYVWQDGPGTFYPDHTHAVGTAHISARALDEALRVGEPAVIGRIADDRLLLDCRTVFASDVPALARALTGAVNRR